MKLNARQDIEANASDVFRLLTDFSRWEREAMRRSAEVQRQDRLETPGVGMAWQVDFTFRGTRRQVKARVVTFDPGACLALELTSDNFAGHARIDLVALSQRRTRLHLKSEVTASSLMGRILLQPLRLAKGRLTGRLQGRLSAFAVSCEDQSRSVQGR